MKFNELNSNEQAMFHLLELREQIYEATFIGVIFC